MKNDLVSNAAFEAAVTSWTMLHPEIESEEDMLQLMQDQEELAQLLLEDPEADRSPTGRSPRQFQAEIRIRYT